MNADTSINYNPFLVEVLFLMVIFFAARLAGRVLIGPMHEVTDKTAAFHQDKTSAPRRLVQAIMVLTLSFLAFYPPVFQTLFGAWLQMPQRHQSSWLEFWLAVFLVTLFEWLAKRLFMLVDKPFPVPELLLSILRVVLFTAIGFAILHFGLAWDISFLLTSTALITAAIGFALRGVIGDLLAGMSLHLVRAVVPSDWIEIDGRAGEVIQTNWRETRLRTVRGHIIVIPNSTVASSVFHNMTWPTATRRHSVFFTVGFKHPPGQVIDALTAAALSVEQVLREPITPDPNVFIREYKDYGIVYDLRFWSNVYFDRVPIEGDVQRMAWYQFERRGIDIPLPVDGRFLDEVSALLGHWRQAPGDDAAERAVDDFKKSDFFTRFLVDQNGDPFILDKDLVDIGKTLRRVRYTRGEVLFRQGDKGESCFLVIRGRLHGRIDYGDASDAVGFTIGVNALVGEMSLLTGLPRTATITADSDVELLKISADTLKKIMLLRQDLPQQLHRLITERAEQNRERYEKYQGQEKARMMQSLDSEHILQRLLRIAGIKN